MFSIHTVKKLLVEKYFFIFLSFYRNIVRKNLVYDVGLTLTYFIKQIGYEHDSVFF